MTNDQVKPIAGGRVWTGTQALERKLVDELGGMDSAIRKARSLANLPETTPAREVRAPRKQVPPRALPSAAGLLGYVLDGISLLSRTPALAGLGFLPQDPHQPFWRSSTCCIMNADAPPGMSSSRNSTACVFSTERTIEWSRSKGLRVCTSMTSHDTPSSSRARAASSAMAQHAPYVTTVTSVPARSTSGTPKGTVKSPMFSGTRSLSRYPLSASMTTPGLSPRKRVL